MSDEVYVGIDVSKAILDVAIGKEKDGETWQAGNDAVGIHKCVTRLQSIRPVLIVIESTGGLERPLIMELNAAELPFALVHPGRVRDFARSLGLLAKTDKLDARLLAHFGAAIQPAVTELPGKAEQNMNALLLRRRQLLDMLVDEKNHLFSTPLSLRSRVEDHIQWLEQEIAELEKQVDELTEQLPEFREKSAILRSAKGVGPILSAKLISGLPELGKLNRKKIAALVGVAPYNNDSGHKHRKRKTAGGREDVREVLYMGTVAAARSNPVIKPFYQHLVKQGKPKKVALVACMRKLLTILNAMIRDMRPWRIDLKATAS